MTRFITMPVQSFIKHSVQTCDDVLPAIANNLEKSLHILRHIPGIVTGSPFGNITLAMHQIEIIFPFPVLMTTISPSSLWIDDMAPVFRPTHQLLIVSLQHFLIQRQKIAFILLIFQRISQQLCHLCHGKIIKSIFQSTGGLLILMKSLFHTILHRNKSIFEI